MDRSPEIDAAVVVLIGNFNPAIFQPSWLASQKLIGEEQAAAVELTVVHPAIAQFRVGWLHLQVEQERFRAETLDTAAFIQLRDFVVGVLTLLEHTPVRACGINRLMHFATESEKVWHRIGDNLVPKAIFDGLLEQPGTSSITLQGRRPRSSASYGRMTVEPSVRVPHGVYFDFNEHYQPDEGAAAEFARNALTTQWDSAQAHFLKSASTLLERAGKKQ